MRARSARSACACAFRRCAKAWLMTTLLVLTTLPDRAAAERLADALIEKRVAACVNILAPCRSVYRWQGATQRDEEHPMLVKTTAERYPALEAAIRAAPASWTAPTCLKKPPAPGAKRCATGRRSSTWPKAWPL